MGGISVARFLLKNWDNNFWKLSVNSSVNVLSMLGWLQVIIFLNKNGV